MLKQTPLFEEHIKAKAKMVPFGGWEMPVQYEGILSEYNDTRTNVSVFDISHMGEFFIEGDAKESGLDRIVTQPLADLPVKSCRYGAICNDKGGVIDDLIVFRIASKKWMIVVNGATIEKDARHFASHILPQGRFHDASSEIGKLDVQGPRSREILKKLIPDIEKLSYYTFDEFPLLGEQRVIISRTGYTGELGYEIYFPWGRMKELWQTVLSLGVKPAGLGARDMLRIEMGYSLYGHELGEDISPLEAGLTRFIDWDKDFMGKAALLKEQERGAKRKIVCFASATRRSPREGYKIYSQEGKEVGRVTSGTFSPYLNRGIGLGFIANPYGKAQEEIFLGDDKQRFPAEIVKKPVYQNSSLKN